jgi:hypothetical protein
MAEALTVAAKASVEAGFLMAVQTRGPKDDDSDLRMNAGLLACQACIRSAVALNCLTELEALSIVASLLAWLVRSDDDESARLRKVQGVASGAIHMTRLFRDAEATGFATKGAC